VNIFYRIRSAVINNQDIDAAFVALLVKKSIDERKNRRVAFYNFGHAWVIVWKQADKFGFDRFIKPKIWKDCKHFKFFMIAQSCRFA